MSGRAPATFVLVHGGWVGGWFWGRVAPLLRKSGHAVFTPTLTGLGERAHLTSPAVGLGTHAEDLEAVLRYEDLRDVVLVGHSYGGMVITAAAERVPERLARLVYFDAFVPFDGEAMADLMGPDMTSAFQYEVESAGGGWRLPLPFPLEAFGFMSPEDLAWMNPRMSEQPWATVREPVAVRNPAAAAIPRTFVECTRLATGLMAQSAQRARAAGWKFHRLDLPHAAPVTGPSKVAALLERIAVEEPT